MSSLEGIFRAVSIDIGTKNFAIYTEDIDLEALNNIKKYPQGRRKLLLPTYDNLTDIYLSGTSVEQYTNVFNLAGDDPGDELTVEIRKSLFKTLEGLEELWKSAVLVVIEKQFINLRFTRKKSGTANMIMIRLAETCFTWILDHHPHIDIRYFPSQYKTVICNCPKTFLKKERKM